MNKNTNTSKTASAPDNAPRKMHREPNKEKQDRNQENARLRTEAFGRPGASAPETRDVIDEANRYYSGCKLGSREEIESVIGAISDDDWLRIELAWEIKDLIEGV